MEYPAQLKETVVRQALAREMTQEELARAHGVSKSSVQQWLRKARERGESAMAHGEDRRARDWSAQERFAALLETEGMSEEELGAWCRRHGLHSHELAQWRRDALAGTAPATTASNEARSEAKRLRQEVAALRKELNRKDKALAETTALLVLQKKARLLWGEDEER